MTKKFNWITKEITIKGMICSRCLKVLSTELRSIGAEVIDIQLGKIVLRFNKEIIDQSIIDKIILENEFEILMNKDSILAEQTKRWVINFIWSTDHSKNLSDFLVVKIGKNYDMLSKNFSKVFDRTIERYHLLLMVERVKELIENDELSFTEIAYDLGYQNLSALSRQFKKETGVTLNQYKKNDSISRIPIDKI